MYVAVSKSSHVAGDKTRESLRLFECPLSPKTVFELAGEEAEEQEKEKKEEKEKKKEGGQRG